MCKLGARINRKFHVAKCFGDVDWFKTQIIYGH